MWPAPAHRAVRSRHGWILVPGAPSLRPRAQTAQPLQVHPAGHAGSSDTERPTEGGGCWPAPQPHPSGPQAPVASGHFYGLAPGNRGVEEEKDERERLKREPHIEGDPRAC